MALLDVTGNAEAMAALFVFLRHRRTQRVIHRSAP